MMNKSKIILYGHGACPGVPPAKMMLNQAKADYEYINIHQDDEGRARVREINNGYESVPTLVFPDGSTLTEPSGGELSQKLETLGYEVPLMARLISNWQMLFIGTGVILAVLVALDVI